jgi:hypothetical protein
MSPEQVAATFLHGVTWVGLAITFVVVLIVRWFVFWLSMKEKQK